MAAQREPVSGLLNDADIVEDDDDNMTLSPGSGLPATIAVVVAVSTIVAVVVSGWSIYLQLKNYRKPALQR